MKFLTKCAVALLLVPAAAYAADPKAAAAGAAAPTTVKKTVCTSDLFYSWKPNPPKNSDDDARGAPPPAEEKPSTTFAGKVSGEGATEEAAKESLNRRLAEAKAGAMETCSKSHQNQAGCLSAQLRTNTRDFQTLDFETRTALVEAVKQDCAARVGSCIEATAGDPTCEEKEEIQEAAAPAAAAGEDKKKKK